MSVKAETTEPPNSIVELHKLFERFDCEESRRKGFVFNPETDDVIISTSAKTGSTLTQQICHGLRSRGDMSFEEINLAIPCLEIAADYEYDLNTKQPFQPQMYRTHFWYHFTPKGAGKYITVVRNPADTALSYYHYYANWFFSKDELSAQDLIEWFWVKRSAPKSYMEEASLFHHIMSWYPHRHDKNVLWLHYEDYRQDLQGCVRLIAQFLEIGADDEELQKLVVEQASIDFMKQHATKFDDHQWKIGRNEAAGLPKYAGIAENPGKVRTGLINSAKEMLPPSTLDKIDQAWNSVVTAVTGYETYEEFRNGINKELKRSFN